MNQIIEPVLRRILSDKISGSAELLFKLNLFLKKRFKKSDDLNSLFPLLEYQFQTFQNINNYLKALKQKNSRNKLTITFFDDIENNYISVYDNIFGKAKKELTGKNKILTISNSHTVLEILKRLSLISNKLHVIICESRPKLEGRILAKRLIKENIKVELITESLAARTVQKCDCVIIGSDAIMKNKDVINKAGSLQLAVLCRHYKKPFYVAAEKSKFSSKIKFNQRKEPAIEIWGNHPKEITIENYYFERIPHELITKIFTEKDI
jgi:translation initiation factor 2B subunit (eIF-2B alpha/beta/delta family)